MSTINFSLTAILVKSLVDLDANGGAYHVLSRLGTFGALVTAPLDAIGHLGMAALKVLPAVPLSIANWVAPSQKEWRTEWSIGGLLKNLIQVVKHVAFFILVPLIGAFSPNTMYKFCFPTQANLRNVEITAPTFVPTTPVTPVAAPTTPAAPVIEPTTPVSTPTTPATPMAAPTTPATPVATPETPATPVATPATPATPVAAPATPATPATAPATPATPATAPATPATAPATPATPATAPATPATAPATSVVESTAAFAVTELDTDDSENPGFVSIWGAESTTEDMAEKSEPDTGYLQTAANLATQAYNWWYGIS
jgi:hypothetical protein